MLTIKFDSQKARYNELVSLFNQERPPVFININKVRSYYQHALQLTKQIGSELNIILEAHTGQQEFINPNSHQSVSSAFITKVGIPVNFLKDYEGKVSVSKPVLERLPDRYKNMAFVRAYRRFAEAEAIRRNMGSYLHVNPIPNLYNNEGDALAIIQPMYEIKNTYRANTSGYNVQGINSSVADIITAPEEWLIAQIDSKQIEPKIYLSTITRDPMLFYLVLEYEDVYYAMADFSVREDPTYSEENTELIGVEEILKLVGSRSRLKTLINAANYGSSLNHLCNLGGETMGTGVHKRLVHHPNRVLYEQEIDAKVSQGERDIYSHFGDKVSVRGSFKHVKNCFINNRIQMDVSRLSSISVLEAHKSLNETGIGNEGIMYSFHKHDEDVYLMHMRAVHHLDYLKGFREYNIEGWLPLTADAKLALNYTKD